MRDQELVMLLSGVVGLVVLIAQVRLFAIHSELVKIRKLMEKQVKE